MNPLVPEAIRREERSNPIYSFSRNCKTTTRYESSFPPRFNHNSSVICIPCSASTESCAYNVGRTVNSRVFRLLSLFPVCSIPLHFIILLFPHFQQWTPTFFLSITLLHTHASPFKSTSQCACQLLSVTPSYFLSLITSQTRGICSNSACNTAVHNGIVMQPKWICSHVNLYVEKMLELSSTQGKNYMKGAVAFLTNHPEAQPIDVHVIYKCFTTFDVYMNDLFHHRCRCPAM